MALVQPPDRSYFFKSARSSNEGLALGAELRGWMGGGGEGGGVTATQKAKPGSTYFRWCFARVNGHDLCVVDTDIRRCWSGPEGVGSA